MELFIDDEKVLVVTGFELRKGGSGTEGDSLHLNVVPRENRSPVARTHTPLTFISVISGSPYFARDFSGALIDTKSFVPRLEAERKISETKKTRRRWPTTRRTLRRTVNVCQYGQTRQNGGANTMAEM
jgi:hypothetical protein